MITLFESENHKNLLFNDLGGGNMIQANQCIIIHNGEGIMLDPGGHKIHTKLFAELAGIMPINGLKHIFFSHQDPDIVAAANAWLMLTDAKAYMPGIWIRFVAHFGVDELAEKKVTKIPDKGMLIQMGDLELKVIPAHFLHSSGNFHLYDPVAKILYSGDVGASPSAPYGVVEDFDSHIKHMESFHKRYMPSGAAISHWAKMIKGLDIEIMAPQHGAVFNGKEKVESFINWFENLEVGADIMGDTYALP